MIDKFETMLRILQDHFKNNLKDDYRATKYNFTQLGTTQPQLVKLIIVVCFVVVVVVIAIVVVNNIDGARTQGEP